MVAALAALDLKQASHWFKVRVTVCPAPPTLVRPVRLLSGGGTCRWRLFVADGGRLHSCLPHLDWLKCSISKHPQPSRRPRQPISAQLSSPNTKCTAHDSLMRGTNRDRPTRQHGRPSASPPPQPHATLLRARQVLLGADLAESRFQKHSLNPTSLRPSSIYRRPDLARHPANVVLGARRPSPSFPATTHRFDDGDPRNKMSIHHVGDWPPRQAQGMALTVSTSVCWRFHYTYQSLGWGAGGRWMDGGEVDCGRAGGPPPRPAPRKPYLALRIPIHAIPSSPHRRACVWTRARSSSSSHR